MTTLASSRPLAGVLPIVHVPFDADDRIDAADLREWLESGREMVLVDARPMAEFRTVSLPGIAWHDLRLIDGQLRIQLKRVDLLHAAEALPALEFYV